MDSWRGIRIEDRESDSRRELITDGVVQFTKEPHFHVLKNYISTNLNRKPPIDVREVGKVLHPFLKKNNQSLSGLIIFLDIFAERMLDYIVTKKLAESSNVFSMIAKDLEGTEKLRFGAFSFHNGRLKVGSYSGSSNASISIELLVYSCEIELILDNKLSDDPLRRKMELDESEKKTFFGRFFTSGDSKKGSDRKDAQVKNQMKAIEESPKEQGDVVVKETLNGILRPVTSRMILELREMGLSVAQHMRLNPFLIGKYINKRDGSEFEVPEHDMEAKVIEAIRNKFSEPLDDKLVSFALEETNGCPNRATNLIKNKRKEASSFLMKHFPALPKEKAVEISDKCLYQETSMLFLATESVLNAIPEENDNAVSIEAILKDESIDKDRRINIAALELFSNNLDRMNRASTLMYALSFEKPANRPKHNGWWDDFDYLSFDNLVTCIRNLTEATPDELLESKQIMPCTVCGSYVHRNQLFDFECRCTFCIECVVANVKQATKGNISTALDCLDASCPNREMVENMDEERKSGAFQVKYLRLQEISKTQPQFKDDIDKYMEMSRLHMTRMMPNFTPCAHCISGQFQGDENVMKMGCHACGKYTCHRCKYVWYDEHQSLTCPKYKMWLFNNHPEDLGLPEGATFGSLITCPKCKEQYLLQRGGCIHFQCKRCPTEFCGACSEIFFTNRNPCPSCSLENRGSLHAHHPRNCVYYLRDEDPEWLTELLEMNDIDWKDTLKDVKAEDGLCSLLVTDQESGPERKCGKEVCNGYPLCRIHIKAHLALLCFDNHVDPVDKYDQHQLNVIAKRENIRLLDGNATVEEHRKIIKEESPIKDEEDE